MHRLLSVIIPAYNEEQSVERVLRDINDLTPQLEDLGYDLEILLILNCCTDRTGHTASRVSFVHDIPLRMFSEDKKGYGYAHRKGIAEAKGDVLLTLDCDNTYPADAIPKMLIHINDGCTFVTTNRLDQDPAMNSTSKLGNYLLSRATSLLAGTVLTDSQSGMWAFKRHHIADLLEGLGSGMELSEQLKIRLARVAPAWIEMPIQYRERIGESKLNPMGDGLRCLWRLVTT